MTDYESILFRVNMRSQCWRLALLVALLIAWWAGMSVAYPDRLYGADYGLLQGGSRNNRLTDAQIKHPKISFYVLRDRWKLQEPQDDRFDFSYNAQQIRRVRAAGKGYIVAPMTGVGGLPSWMPGPRYDGSVVPWSPYIPLEWSEFIHTLANSQVDGIRFKNDPACWGVWLGCLGEPSQEGHLNGMEKVRGYSPAAMLSVIVNSGTATANAFYPKPCIYSVSGQRAVQVYQPAALDHYKALLGPARLRVQHNSLGVQTSVTATHHKILLDAHRQGYKVGAEMVQPGHTAALSKFPQASYFVLYSGDEKGLK